MRDLLLLLKSQSKQKACNCAAVGLALLSNALAGKEKARITANIADVASTKSAFKLNQYSDAAYRRMGSSKPKATQTLFVRNRGGADKCDDDQSF